MTHDKIKEIAEDYATSDGVRNEIVSDICETFMHHLQTDYCIVEKSKVRNHYQLALKDSEEMNEESDEKVLLELLFGEDILGTSEFQKDLIRNRHYDIDNSCLHIVPDTDIVSRGILNHEWNPYIDQRHLLS